MNRFSGQQTLNPAANPAVNPPERLVAEFWFDPICPWSWQTSRWILEVERLRPITIHWNVMSLALLQDSPRLPQAYRQSLFEARALARVCVAAQAEHGDKVLGPLYTALGTRLHDRRVQPTVAMVSSALRQAGLPQALADALESAEYEEALRASHGTAVALAGEGLGTPVIALHAPEDSGAAPVAFFGPVVSPVPRGEAAARLWDGLALVASVPGFTELKRTRAHMTALS
ncbi:mycothiol-dependent nitroreductase Rv2466c family protein [Streptacidiphilus fuscans]|uniref:DsbA family protein n=1 Tax=Streptacidiphilus fuscans TaxID=2789292 RepID=A0A931B5J6_9ACTN|nr:DsbA family protein [Streptacidiphilus fuscans]MBF9070779.1 DsbA family protein [Streptacidiphilus fuscans]